MYTTNGLNNKHGISDSDETTEKKKNEDGTKKPSSPLEANDEMIALYDTRTMIFSVWVGDVNITQSIFARRAGALHKYLYSLSTA